MPLFHVCVCDFRVVALPPGRRSINGGSGFPFVEVCMMRFSRQTRKEAGPMHSDPLCKSGLCAQRVDWTSVHCHRLVWKGCVLLGFLSLLPPEVRKCEQMSHPALLECATQSVIRNFSRHLWCCVRWRCVLVFDCSGRKNVDTCRWLSLEVWS